MLPVLHLDPAVKAASTIAAVAMFRHQPVDAIDTALQDFDTENSKISALWTSC
jgi:hypothetical protein